MKKKNKAREAVSAYRCQTEADEKSRSKKHIKTDVTGSYTGTDADNQAPVQDADDL